MGKSSGLMGPGINARMWFADAKNIGLWLADISPPKMHNDFENFAHSKFLAEKTSDELRDNVH